MSLNTQERQCTICGASFIVHGAADLQYLCDRHYDPYGDEKKTNPPGCPTDRLMVVGERELACGLSLEDAERWERDWNASPLIPMLTRPAFASGRSRAMLDAYYNLPASTAYVNLLSPHPEAGRWNQGEALGNATTLERYLWNQSIQTKVVALGRRVEKAFGIIKVPFGTVLRSLTGATATIMILPHPSPRSRFFNDEARLLQLRRWVREFLRT